MSFIIGDEIKKRVRKKGLKNKAFADQMNMEERNLYHFFKKESMDIDQLLEASKILDFDFLTLYIQNSKYKGYAQQYDQDLVLPNSHENQSYHAEKNQISFTISIKGPLDIVTKEMSNFLQFINNEAEDRGLHLG